MRAVFTLAFILALCGCSTHFALPKDEDFPHILASTRAGAFDVCRDRRWPAWRFQHGDAGRALLSKLRDATDAQVKAIDANAEVAEQIWLEERPRLRGLTRVLDAVLAATDAAQWEAARAAEERRIAAWHAEADAIERPGLEGAVARQSVWRRARDRVSLDWRGGYAVQAGIADCMTVHVATNAEAAVTRLLVAALDKERWPTEATDGNGATRAVLNLAASGLGTRYLKKNAERLTAAADAGRIPAGGWALLRVELDPDPLPPRAFADAETRFMREWAAVRLFLRSLPPPSNVADDLYRRVRADQFVRKSVSAFFKNYPDVAVSKDIFNEMLVIDKENTERVKELLQGRDWFDEAIDGEGSSRDGWLLVQHADHDPSFQRDILKRLEPLLGTGRIRPADYALLWDRVAVKDKRLQRYGSQMECRNGQRVAQVGVEDPERLDERRKAMGLSTWHDYKQLMDENYGRCAASAPRSAP